MSASSAIAVPSHAPDDSGDALLKRGVWRKEADDQVRLVIVPREVEEVAGMNQHAVFREQFEHKILF